MMAYPTVRVTGTGRGRLADWLRRGLDLVFPPRCVGCRRVGTWFCQSCVASIEPIPQPICRCCGRPIPHTGLCVQCHTHSSPLSGSRSAAVHSGALREAIHHLKYQGRRELAGPLGDVLIAYWRNLAVPVDLVVPVPLHASRERERGYNQAGLLADTLACRAQLQLNDGDLVRTRDTPPQVGLRADERRANVQDAFVWTGPPLTGLTVLLIDDVCTTGATLEACARELRLGGADSVWALTLARPLEPTD